MRRLKRPTTMNSPNKEANVGTIPPNAKSQRSKILRLLLDRNDWVPSPEIAALAQQYNSRIFELRALGFVIENKTMDTDTGRHSWFRLVRTPTPEPELPAKKEIPSMPSEQQEEETLPLFRRHR
jgi:hypothetical protein